MDGTGEGLELGEMCLRIQALIRPFGAPTPLGEKDAAAIQWD